MTDIFNEIGIGLIKIFFLAYIIVFAVNITYSFLKSYD